jgi:DNA-binding transcriptional MocR family regulator
MWTPTLEKDADTVSGRLLGALRRDIATGQLPAGAKLPPHRDLAHQLGIGIGTVTAVYAEAAREGLVIAQVGRGSFVANQAEAPPRPDGPIQMAQNVPPLEPSQRHFPATLARLRQRADLLDQLDYAPPAGHESHRRAGYEWLKRVSSYDNIDLSRLLVTSGAQQAMTLVLDTLCKRGDGVLTEAATYFGIKSIMQTGGYHPVGVAMDKEGILPGALAQAAADSGAKVVYTLPTLQNPTGRIMSYRRRMEIIEVAREYNLWIVEDDLYSAFALGVAPPPISAYAPERSFYINGSSKALAPGLRTGYLLCPTADHFDRVLRLIRARVYSPATMGAMITTQWIEDGTADAIVAELQDEMAARGRMAAERLGGAFEIPGDPRCPHLWLPMSEIEAERFAARAMRAGVELTPPSAPVVDTASISGVRLCLGAVPDRALLAEALDKIAVALAASDHAAGVV